MSCIRLQSIKYSEYLGEPKEWVLDLPLSRINLLVGKNATGKSRSLNVIVGLSKLLSSTLKYRVNNGFYDVEFDNNGIKLRYVINIKNENVESEQYFINNKRVLKRGLDDKDEIETHKADGDPQMMQFSPPKNELAAVVRRDAIQHPYLELLHDWAQATSHYTFGASLGKDRLAFIRKGAPEVNVKNANEVVGIFSKAQREFKDIFIDAVKLDMATMQYQIDSIDIVSPKQFSVVDSEIEGRLACIGIKEEGLDRVIDQTEMSQGMFRALSILIQVNYSQLAKHASCILIDDIGEGLDFERSTSLIEILRQKAADSSFQLILTTNDKFVMNKVPLNEWLILQREGGSVKVRNYINSKQLFEDFKFTGLSNFSLFEMDFLKDQESLEVSE